jgi:Flp pilus assembly protein TadB
MHQLHERVRALQANEDDREAVEALDRFHAELQRIETEHNARMAAIRRMRRRFFFTWGVATALLVVNLLTIKEPTITLLYQLTCLAWVIQSALDWRSITKKDSRS